MVARKQAYFRGDLEKCNYASTCTPRIAGSPMLDVRLSIITNTFFTNKEELSIGYGHSPWQLPSLGEVPQYRITITPFYLYHFS